MFSTDGEPNCTNAIRSRSKKDEKRRKIDWLAKRKIYCMIDEFPRKSVF